MIKQATDWAKNRYSLSPVRTSNGGYEIGVVRKDYSPANIRVYTIKKINNKYDIKETYFYCNRDILVSYNIKLLPLSLWRQVGYFLRNFVSV